MTDVTQPVLVGIDGSDHSIGALHWAVRYARAVGVPLQVVTVLPQSIADSDAADEVEASLVAEALRILDADGAVAYEVDSRRGKPAEQLVRSSQNASVVVLGSQGHGAIAGAVIGSVSQHVARHAECPVVVVREQARESATRVVVGVDGSEASRGALEWAAAYASAVGSELVAVYGFLTTAQSPAVMSGFIPMDVDEEIAAAEQLVAGAVAPVQERYPDLALRTEALTVPASTALTDGSEAAALVVVGSRGRGAFEGLLLGSVSQSLLHRARCSVAVVR